MWIFTNFGFFSAVQHFKNHDMIVVRARSRWDLSRLIERFGNILNLKDSNIQTSETTDYRYRVNVDRALWSKCLALIVNDISYYNFKDSVRDNLGEFRADLCHEVWDIMWQVQEQEVD